MIQISILIGSVANVGGCDGPHSGRSGTCEAGVYREPPPSTTYTFASITTCLCIIISIYNPKCPIP